MTDPSRSAKGRENRGGTQALPTQLSPPVPSQLKILLFNTQLEAGGAQKAMLTLARGLQQRGHHVMVATMYDKGDYASLFRRQYGINIVDLRMKPAGPGSLLGRLKSAVMGLVQLSRLIREGRFDVVQTFSHYSNIVGPLMAYTGGVRVCISSQRMSLRGAPRWLLLLDRIVANSFLVRKMVAVSEGTRRFSTDVEGIRPDKLITIRNGIDADRFSRARVDPGRVSDLRQEMKLPGPAQVIICVARLHQQKGHRFLLEALKVVQRSWPDVHLLLVGEGDLHAGLVERGRELGIEAALHFLGMRQEIPELLAASEIFVLPSLWEGLPNSVLEAMAMEVPVIVTNVDGCAEVIDDGETGILVPAGDSDALADAILHLLSNPALCKSMASAARRRITEHFSEERNTSAFEDLYQQLADGRPE